MTGWVWSGAVADPDLLALMKQIHAEAALLRAIAHEADMEVGTIVAASRRKRELEQLRRERHVARSAERAREPGEDR